MTAVRWEGLSHVEIYQRVQAGPGRTASVAVESAWADTESVISGIEERLVTTIRQTGGAWEGAAADATRAGLTPLGRWAADAAVDARHTATGITAQGEQAAWLRNAMPSPTDPLWDERVGRSAADPLYQLADPQALQRKGAEDTAQAVHLMNTYTSNSYDNIRLMNYWTVPPTVTVEAVGAGAPVGTPVAGGSTAGQGGVGIGGAAGAGGGATPVGAVVPVGGPVGGATGGTSTTGRPSRGSPGGGGPATPGEAGGRRPDLGAVLPGPSSAVPGPGPGTRVGRPGGIGVRPVVPGAPARPVPTPSWRDLIPGADARDSRPGPAAPGPGRPGLEPIVPPARPTGQPVPATTGPATTGPTGRPTGPEPTTPAGRAPGPDPSASARGAPLGPTAGGTAPLAGARPGSPAHPGIYPPMLGLGSGAIEREHRRPDYLLDDSGAFVDDRWFPPPVIGGDDPPPPRPARLT